MQQFEIKAQPRTHVGKGASRRLRRAGMVPGILYGTEREPRALVFSHDELANHVKLEAFFSHILTLHVGDDSEKVVVKDLQRHPYKARIVHIDFLRIDEKEELTMRVPLHFLNEAKCVGVRLEGGVVSHILTEVEVTCLPKDLPEYLEVDLAEAHVGDTIHLGDLKLPPGVTLYALEHGGDVSQPVASVHIPRAIEVEEEAVPAEGEEIAAAGEVPVEGEAAGEEEDESSGDKDD